MGVGLPVVGGDGEAELLGEAGDDGAAGEGVKEGGGVGVELGSCEGAADEREQLALVAKVGDELCEDEVVGVPRGVCGGGVAHGC